MQKMNMRFGQHKGSEELMLLIIYEPRTHLIEVGRQRIVVVYAKQREFFKPVIPQSNHQTSTRSLRVFLSLGTSTCVIVKTIT